jgi:hypothetical protein
MAICFAQLMRRCGGTMSPSFSILCSGPYGQNSMIIQKTGANVHTPLLAKGNEKKKKN